MISRLDQFSKLENIIFRLMDEQLSPDLIYHNKEHTQWVIETVEWLGESENITLYDRFLLRIAALFHDIGFIEAYDGHEEESCRIATLMLSDLDFLKEEISVICELIVATKVPHNPKNILQEIICDADLDYLGTEDFYIIGDRLRKELILHGKLSEDLDSWTQYQIRFLDSHRFFTMTSRRLREPVKQEFLRQLKSNTTLGDV